MDDTSLEAERAARNIRSKLWGERREKIERNLEQLDPDLAKLVFEVAYDSVLARPDLDLKTRELLAVTALLSVGGEGELETHIRGALNCGATFNELKETMLQAAMFLGFPKALLGMRVLQSVRASYMLESAPHIEP